MPTSDPNTASPGPRPVRLPPATPEPRDVAFPGVMRLAVDATDLSRRIFRVRQTVPVAGGEPLTLLYPEWLPGYHAANAPLSGLAGLIATARGKRVEWVRDTVDVYAFHLIPPADATEIDLEFQFTSPMQWDQGRVVMTPEMLNLQWNAVSFYPAGYFTRRVMAEVSLTLPPGWSFGTALETATQDGDTARFKPVAYDHLIDSPVMAGLYSKRIDLDPDGRAPVHLNLFADRPDQLEAKPEQIEAHRAMVQQAYRLFGARHYDHYDFLLALSDRLGGIGLEHHQSSEDGVASGYFTDWAKQAPKRDLLPHEFVHSWNGKFRRPADLWTADFSTPMQASLLWVYEGQTQYWGIVLAARSGLLTHDQALEAIALTAATYDQAPGRAWRALQDTTNDPIIAQRRPNPWPTWERSEDYYSEGQLVWLDADTLIRERSEGARSLDDFARAFFGMNDGSFTTLPYDFETVVTALDAVQPHDWATFLRARLDGHGPGAPLDGIARGGYRLVYGETPTDYQKQLLGMRDGEDFSFSLGFALNEDGGLASVVWDSPAFQAGLTIGARLLAVNGIAYDADRLRAAISAAKTGSAPIELLVRSGDHYRTVAVDYRGGLRYPRLEKAGEGPASLDAILAPKP